MATVAVGGVSVYYEMAGSGHPVVFVHGHGLDCRMWEGQMAGLSRLYTVIRYDMRGHGRSEAPATGYSRRHLAEELFGLVEALDLTKPSIVGHSRGGQVGIEYALAHPTRISTLTLAGSGVEGFFSEEEIAHANEKQKALLLKEGVSARFVRGALLSPLYNGVRGNAAKLSLLKSMIGAWSGADWRDEAVYPRPERLQIERLGEMPVPVLVAVGERDLQVFHDVAEVFCGAFRVVRKATVPEAGHLAPMEEPAAFNDILLDFIGGAAGKALL
jgi:pimeloyl-ACP methyl ester carboxylesterase